jgi:hypothetical protein
VSPQPPEKASSWAPPRTPAKKLQLPENFKISREPGTKYAIIGSPFPKPKD